MSADVPAQPPAPASGAAGEVLTFPEFQRMRLVIAEIKEVADHPKADKLYILKADLGEGQLRQLVAGLKPSHKPEQLVGRQVVVVANLAPASIRGERSEGMLLAAEAPGGLPALLSVEQPVPVGAKVR